MIILKKTTVDRVDSDREVFTIDARRQLQEEVAWRKKVLDGEEQKSQDGKGTYKPLKKIQDPQAMRQELKQYEKDLERGSPIKMSPAARNSLWKKAKRLKDEFTVGMLTSDELHPVRHREIVEDGTVKTAVVADYDKMNETKAVERNAAWYKKNEGKTREFKRIMKVLEPDNPNVSDYERFRPKTRKVKSG